MYSSRKIKVICYAQVESRISVIFLQLANPIQIEHVLLSTTLLLFIKIQCKVCYRETKQS